MVAGRGTKEVYRGGVISAWALEWGGPKNAVPFQTAERSVHSLPLRWQLALGRILSGMLRYSGPSWLCGVLPEAAVAPEYRALLGAALAAVMRLP